jgi:hypothetical protein
MSSGSGVSPHMGTAAAFVERGAADRVLEHVASSVAVTVAPKRSREDVLDRAERAEP